MEQNKMMTYNSTNRTYSDTTMSGFTSSYVVLPMSVLTFILNLLSLVVLRRSKKIRENRFQVLTVCLSITDITSSVFSFVLSISSMMNKYGKIMPQYICFIAHLITTTSVTVSMIQIVFICLERLFATFPFTRDVQFTKYFFLAYVLSVVCASLYSSSVYIIYGSVDSTYCSAANIFQDKQWIFDITFASLQSILFLFIVLLYTIVIARLYKRIKQVNPILFVRANPTNIDNTRECQSNADSSHNDNRESLQKMYDMRRTQIPIFSVGTSNSGLIPSDNSNRKLRRGKLRVAQNDDASIKQVQLEHKRPAGLKTDIGSNANKITENATTSFKRTSMFKRPDSTDTTSAPSTNSGSLIRIKRFKKTVLTLGFIIMVTTLTTLPCVITQMVYAFNTKVVSLTALQVTSSIILFNPLLDPLVYVLRIDEFRKTIRCNFR